MTGLGQASQEMPIDRNRLRSLASKDSIAIIGYGNFGKALACRFETCGVEFCVGSRDLNRESCRISEYDMRTYEEAAKMADIIILAVPAHVYCDFSFEMRTALEGKIVVDISNASTLRDHCNAERLADMLPNSFVVKAFNTLSAWSMEKDVYGASRETYICSDSIKARISVMQLARDMGLEPVESGRLSAARLLEKKPLKVFPEWRFAFLMTLVLFLFTFLYIYLRFFLYISVKEIAVYAVMPIANAVTGCMVLLQLTFVFLPGVLAGIIQLTRGTKYSLFPKWLDTWMKARKQLGLFALFFAAIHGCFSLILLSGEYYEGMSEIIVVNGAQIYHKYRWNAEISLLFATLSVTILCLQGLASLPTVNQSLSWREWDFVQSKLGYAGFFFGFLHVIFYAGIVLTPDSIRRWKYGVPHQLFLLLVSAAIVMLLKVFLIIPGISNMMKRIKAGWERHRNVEEYQSIS